MEEQKDAGSEELHIASVVVYVHPHTRESVRSCIEIAPGAEIHLDAENKMIVTLEAGSTRKIVEIMEAIRALPGVADVVLVYQHAEPMSALEQEVQ